MAEGCGLVTPGPARLPAAFQSRYGCFPAPSSTKGKGSIEPPGSVVVDWHWIGPLPLVSRKGPSGLLAVATVRQKRPKPCGSSDVCETRTAEYENQVLPICVTPGA